MPADSQDLTPASASNRARQNLSRKNITHPIRWTDKDIESATNRRRKIDKRDRKSELRRLH